MNAEPPQAAQKAHRGDFDANLTDLGNDTANNTAVLTQSYSSPGSLQNVPLRGQQSLHIPKELKRQGTSYQATRSTNGGTVLKPHDVTQGHHSVKTSTNGPKLETFVGSRGADYQNQLHQTNQINGAPVNSCSNYNPSSVNFTGTAFYPMADTNQYQQQRGEGLPYSSHPVPYQGELYQTQTH